MERKLDFYFCEISDLCFTSPDAFVKDYEPLKQMFYKKGEMNIAEVLPALCDLARWVQAAYLLPESCINPYHLYKGLEPYVWFKKFKEIGDMNRFEFAYWSGKARIEQIVRKLDELCKNL